MGFPSHRPQTGYLYSNNIVYSKVQVIVQMLIVNCTGSFDAVLLIDDYLQWTVIFGCRLRTWVLKISLVVLIKLC